jgi:hypothetical protein
MPNTATHKASHRTTGKAHARTKAVAKARASKSDKSQAAAFATSLDAVTKFFDGYFTTQLQPGDFAAAQKDVPKLDGQVEDILGNYSIGTVVQWAGQILSVAAQSLGEADGPSAGQVGPVPGDCGDDAGLAAMLAMLGGDDDGSITDASDSDDDGSADLGALLGSKPRCSVA